MELTRAICEFAQVKVVCTQAAFHFVAKEKLIEAGAQEVLSDQDEWSEWKAIGNPVVHIEVFFPPILPISLPLLILSFRFYFHSPFLAQEMG
jgi:hypothetical protein